MNKTQEKLVSIRRNTDNIAKDIMWIEDMIKTSDKHDMGVSEADHYYYTVIGLQIALDTAGRLFKDLTGVKHPCIGYVKKGDVIDVDGEEPK